SARADLSRLRPDAVLMSAVTGEGVAEALRRVEKALSRRWLEREIVLPAASAGMAHHFYESAQVLSRQTRGEATRWHLRVTAENWKRLQTLVSEC
ncbi:MAG: hypothetical protein AAB262_01350, partial [Elusimicrobiota bacterium]